jgi:hypothetical protein
MLKKGERADQRVGVVQLKETEGWIKWERGEGGRENK